jgi:hypothetical protein
VKPRFFTIHLAKIALLLGGALLIAIVLASL